MGPGVMATYTTRTEWCSAQTARLSFEFTSCTFTQYARSAGRQSAILFLSCVNSSFIFGTPDAALLACLGDKAGIRMRSRGGDEARSGSVSILLHLVHNLLASHEVVGDPLTTPAFRLRRSTVCCVVGGGVLI